MDTLRMIANTRFQDALDILFLTMVACCLYLRFRGTKSILSHRNFGSLSPVGAAFQPRFDPQADKSYLDNVRHEVK